jgi:hypothetical protein
MDRQLIGVACLPHLKMSSYVASHDLAMVTQSSAKDKFYAVFTEQL